MLMGGKGATANRSRRWIWAATIFVMLAVPVALLAAPRAFGFDDPDGFFLQLGFALLAPLLTFAMITGLSLPGIQFTVTKPAGHKSAYLGWKPRPAAVPDAAGRYVAVGRAADYATDPDLDLIASWFPGPVTLYPVRRKWLTVLLVFAFFDLVFLLATDLPAPMRWFCLAMSGAGTVAAAINLLPGAAYLTLTRDGFETRRYFHRYQGRWTNVDDFDVWHSGRASGFVVFDEAGKSSMYADMNVITMQHTSYVPDTYGFSAEDLARLMNFWRSGALSATRRDTSRDIATSL